MNREETSASPIRWPALLTWRRSVLLFALGALLGVGLGWQPVLRGFGTLDARTAAPRVAMVGVHVLDAHDLMLASAVSEGTAFSALDAGVVAERIARHPWIERANGIALPPRRLLLRVIEREPVAQVEVGGSLWWVDAEGLAFAAVGDAVQRDVPTIIGVPDASPERGHRLLDLAVSVCRAVAGSDSIPTLRTVRVGSAAPERLPEITLDGDIRIAIGPGQLHRKLHRLEQLFIELEGNELTGIEIDLRFGNRMVLRGEAVRSAALTSLRRNEGASGNRSIGH